MREWLPEGHLAHYVGDLVDDLDLSEFYAGYEGDGRRNSPYEPRMMATVLVYGYATRVFSSRRLARELGVANFGKLSLDGTKVRPNASKRKAMSYGRMVEEESRLAGEIEGLLGRAAEVDAAEDERYGEENRGDKLPAELRRREDRLTAIRAAKERLEEARRKADDAGGRRPEWKRNPRGGRPYKRDYGEPEETAQSNFTNPESAIMKTSSEGYQQCYNAQVAVEGGHQLVVATEVTSNASDQGALPTLLDAVEERYGARPASALADAMYCNEADLAEMESRGVDACVAAGREGKAAARNAERHPATCRMIEKLSTPEGRARYVEASGCRRRRTAGSRKCSDSGASACGD